MSDIAIIPARGGSKRIPRKNIKNFLGKPIIAYSIEAALESQLFDEVMVSTDDEEIADIAFKYGAVVPFMRSKENSSDTANTIDVLIEVLERYKNEKMEFDYGCCIYPTAPLLSVRNLIEAYDLLIEERFDSISTIVSYGYPIQRALQFDNRRKMYMVNENYLFSRSQDLKKRYHDAGQFYLFNIRQFLKSKLIWNDNSGGYVMRELQVQDIDTLEDWKLAELKYQLLNE